MERTFIIIKPDAVQRGLIGEIIHRFERRGLKIVALRLKQDPARAGVGTLGTRQPKGRGRFVQSPHGLDAGMIFCDASLAQQIRRPVIAFGCVKSHTVIITKVSLPHTVLRDPQDPLRL